MKQKMQEAGSVFSLVIWRPKGLTSETGRDMMHYATMKSPIGLLTIAAEEDALQFIWFDAGKHPKTKPTYPKSSSSLVRETMRQLQAYFAKDLTQFDLPLKLTGTEFQLAVWKELRDIPYGETMSYGELARRIGNPNASRAVGAANGANPIPIVIPCHRVIGQNGKMVGFGGGLAIKEALLKLERSPYESRPLIYSMPAILM
jgi:methylated-DNA-[protein]-cysteine S-methyltransferase